MDFGTKQFVRLLRITMLRGMSDQWLRWVLLKTSLHKINEHTIITNKKFVSYE